MDAPEARPRSRRCTETDLQRPGALRSRFIPGGSLGQLEHASVPAFETAIRTAGSSAQSGVIMQAAWPPWPPRYKAPGSLRLSCAWPTRQPAEACYPFALRPREPNRMPRVRHVGDRGADRRQRLRRKSSAGARPFGYRTEKRLRVLRTQEKRRANGLAASELDDLNLAFFRSGSVFKLTHDPLFKAPFLALVATEAVLLLQDRATPRRICLSLRRGRDCSGVRRRCGRYRG